MENSISYHTSEILSKYWDAVSDVKHTCPNDNQYMHES